MNMNNLSLPINDNVNNLDESIQSMDEPQLDLDIDIDNESTLESVVNDAIPPPHDPLFNDNISIDVPHDDDEDDDIDIDVNKDSNHLSFDQNESNDDKNDDDDDTVGIKPRDWSRRAKKTFAFFKRKEGKEFSFDDLVKSQTKRETVVGVFYQLLVFKNSDLIDLEQEEAFGDITIRKTNNF